MFIFVFLFSMELTKLLLILHFCKTTSIECKTGCHLLDSYIFWLIYVSSNEIQK